MFIKHQIVSNVCVSSYFNRYCTSFIFSLNNLLIINFQSLEMVVLLHEALSIGIKFNCRLKWNTNKNRTKSKFDLLYFRTVVFGISLWSAVKFKWVSHSRHFNVTLEHKKIMKIEYNCCYSIQKGKEAILHQIKRL